MVILQVLIPTISKRLSLLLFMVPNSIWCLFPPLFIASFTHSQFTGIMLLIYPVGGITMLYLEHVHFDWFESDKTIITHILLDFGKYSMYVHVAIQESFSIL